MAKDNIIVQGAIVVALVIGAMWLLSSILSILGIVVTILVWMLTGYLASRLLGSKGASNPLQNVALGLAGGIVGGFVLRLIGLGGLGNIWLVGSIISGVIGAIIVVFLVRLFVEESFAK